MLTSFKMSVSKWHECPRCNFWFDCNATEIYKNKFGEVVDSKTSNTNICSAVESNVLDIGKTADTSNCSDFSRDLKSEDCAMVNDSADTCAEQINEIDGDLNNLMNDLLATLDYWTKYAKDGQDIMDIYQTRKSMQKIKETHTKDTKEFSCQHCIKIFPSLYRLRRHEKTHQAMDVNDEKARKIKNVFSCSSCDKIFSNKGSLLAHAQESHGSSFPFSCLLCGAGFMQRWKLAQHTLIHTGMDLYLHA